MIAALRGVVLERNLVDAVVDVSGVGYRVFLSQLSLARLPPEGQEVFLRVRTIVREDVLDLFGFLTRAEEDMFLLLTSVSKVGPKVAMAVLSGLEVPELAHAIGRGEVARLTKIHGVGKKTAERLVLELKDKVKGVALAPRAEPGGAAVTPLIRSDLVSALLNLGYKQAQAERSADVAAAKVGPDAPLEALFREALKSLRSGS